MGDSICRVVRIGPQGLPSHSALEAAAEAFEMNLIAELDSDKAEFMLHFSQFDALSHPGLEVVEIDRTISYYHSDRAANKACYPTQFHQQYAQDWLCGPICGPSRDMASMAKVRSQDRSV